MRFEKLNEKSNNLKREYKKMRVGVGVGVRVRVRDGGKELWVDMRIWIRNGFFWGIPEGSKQSYFYSVNQIINDNEISTKIRKMRL